MSKIKPKDLRIGNLITDENGFQMEVVTIGTDYICADFEGNEGDVWEFDFKYTFPKPIPLSEEWLLKFGFKDTYLGWIRKDIVAFNKSSLAPFISNEYGSLAINDIKYVHELQNLYYALTKKELELKQTT